MPSVYTTEQLREALERYDSLEPLTCSDGYPMYLVSSLVYQVRGLRAALDVAIRKLEEE